MTSPPPKRLRRTTVVSSDDEDSAADSQTSTASLNVTAQSLNLRKNSQSQEIRLRKSIKSSSKGTKKVTASKAKAIIAKGNNITKNASIYSFFTGATQSNSQSPLRNKSPEDENNPLSPEDLIEDNYSDDPRFNVSLRTSQYREDGSRSLNGQASKGTHVESSIVAKSKQFSTKVLAISPKNSITISTSVDSRPWADLYPPESLDELVVHKRKVADVHRWLVNVKEGRERKVCCCEIRRQNMLISE